MKTLMAGGSTSKTAMDIETSSQNQPRFSFGFPAHTCREKIPFFLSRSRGVKRDTWLVSLLVIFHVVAFIATMTVNDCAAKSQGNCAVGALGRFSFQPLSENPLLGPAASTLDEMGALRRALLINARNGWRLFTSMWLHAGVFHFLVNLAGLIVFGTYMEQEFGPLRVGIIYALSAFLGSLFSALFVRNIPAVCASGASCGMVGAILSALLRDWNFYSRKFAALALIFVILIVNLILGLLPYVDNFSSIGGFISGLLLGFLLLFTPETEKVPQHEASFISNGCIESLIKLREKLDRPVMRSVSLTLFSLLFAGCVLAALQGVDMNRYCNWCRYIDCIPVRSWSCNDMTTSCETMVGEAALTLTCTRNGNFRILPYTNVSKARIEDVCTLICS